MGLPYGSLFLLNFHMDMVVFLTFNSSILNIFHFFLSSLEITPFFEILHKFQYLRFVGGFLGVCFFVDRFYGRGQMVSEVGVAIC